MEAESAEQDQELSDEEEEMEPKLRYERILNDMPEILRNGAASCIAVHPKFIALGMHSGVVYILDHQGNNIRNKELQLHSDTVLQLSIDEQGDHLASCSRDGKVVVHGLYSSDQNQRLTFDRPVGAVAIDPNFYRSGSGRRFVTGVDKVVLYEKGFLSRYRTTILHQGEGPVRNISWKGRFAAWATDLTILVYDMQVLDIICMISRDRDPLLKQPELHRCILTWRDERCLLVGWADRVKVCCIRQRDPSQRTVAENNVQPEQDSTQRNQADIYVEIVSMFQTDYYVCGLAHLCSGSLVALTVLKNTDNSAGVGRQYLEQLIERQEFERAAEMCPTVFGADARFWEEQVYRFARLRQLRCLAPVLPQGGLDPTAYEMVLNEFLQLDPEGFLKLICEWDSALYSVPTVVNAVRDRLTYEPASMPLLKGLAHLYSLEGKFDLAIAIYLEIGAADAVFTLVQKHGLYGVVQEKLALLIRLDEEKANQLLVNSTDRLPPATVADRLRPQPQALFRYLDALFKRSPALCEAQHMELARLYAEFEPDKLLPLLRQSHSYPLEEALRLCQERQLTPATIFLLKRMGNTKEALHQIMAKLNDVHQAITFCKEHDDSELWADLIEYSLDKPPFITTLLHKIGAHVNPILLIVRIPMGLDIPQLRDSLVKIMRDYNLQISLREGCKKILVSDCIGLLQKLHRQQSRGIAIAYDQLCHACNRRILSKDVRHLEDVVVFFCKHAFHSNCLPSLPMCSLCSADKQAQSLGA
ncbi:vacuolar protein sorting-associated protein 41 homolog isoform X2 [Dermacentor silvarum]|uniref:vacuolar protein sorting-associated protein 41 homolog isoform X2 n=1 Tax=Dermacentor silvarum TaxID=543639 RepID=UPI002100E813|nr:vacuolar protein sorting-associated protein 41 homolog isoform X2 [Dermacentor silvarum]